MYSDKNIKYISYLLEYLNEDDFCNLIKLLTGKTQFYNPYDTCREFFLSFLLRLEDYTTVYLDDMFDYVSVIDDRDIFYDTGENDPIFNSYFRLLEHFKIPFCFEHKNQKFTFYSPVIRPESDEGIKVCVNVFNDIFITDNILIDENGNLSSEFSKIIRALSEFIVRISDEDKNKFRDYIGAAINNIILNKRCYIPYFVNKDRMLTRIDYYNFETEETTGYQIIEKNNITLIIQLKINSRIQEEY